MNLDHSVFKKYVRSNDQLADILTQGMFTTMQWLSLLTLWQIRRPCESNEVRSFTSKPFSLVQLWQSSQAMFQIITQTESVDQRWSPHASKRLKSGCVLDNHLTLEQLSNPEFTCTQDKRDLLAGKFFDMNAMENFLQVDTSSQILRNKKVCQTKMVQLALSCQKCTKQKFTSSQILFFVWESRR